MNISEQELQMLAQAERDMDSGKLKYVMHMGQRNIVSERSSKRIKPGERANG